MKFSILAIATLAVGVIAAPAPEADASVDIVERTFKNKCDKYQDDYKKCKKYEDKYEWDYKECKKGEHSHDSPY